MTPEEQERVHAEVERSPAAQQLPATVSNPAAVSTVVAQLRTASSQQHPDQEVAMTLTRQDGE
jgi:hypothetical protein